MAFDFRTLVTDRTQQDVEYVRQLVDKLVTGTATESEKAEWNSFTLKGVYNYTDLNRVIAAMEDLKVRLEECGYVVPGYQRIKIERTNPSRLPEGSTELEYIESTGTQHIDTGLVTQSEKLRVECEFRYTAAHASTALFGNQKGTSSPYAFSFTLYGVGPDIYVGASAPATSITTEVGKTHRLVLEADNGALTVTLDGTITRGTYSGSLNHTLSTALFGNNINGSVSQKCSARIKKWRAYDNGSLVRDFIPCKLSDGSVGLWDDVEGKFYGNAGTGTFVAGPAAEIVELEYIEGSGTQYVNTGFNPTGNTRVVMDFDLMSGNAGYPTLFGAWTASGNAMYGVMLKKSSRSVLYHYSNNHTTLNADISGRHLVEVNNGQFLVDETVIETRATASFTASNPLILFDFGGVETRGTNRAVGKLYSCQIYDNGLLVRDYVPAKTIEGEVGLYDRVFKEFYRNAGTGEFVAGPEVVKAPGNSQTYLVRADNEYGKELDPYLWYEGDSPTVSQMEQYIGNVTALKGVLKLMRTAPKVPSDMENLTVDEANHIEIILLTVDQMLTNMILTVDTSWATGTAYTGIYAKEAN